MHYHENDLQRLISDLRYLTLAKQQSAQSFSSLLLRDAKELTSILMQYPDVKYEPLDYHYLLLKYLPSADADLIEELCIHYGWRGTVVAAWLTCFSPEANKRLLLTSSLKKGYQINNWLIEAAIAEIDGVFIHSHQEFQKNVRDLRQLLKAIMPSRFFLPKSAINADSNKIEEDRNKILKAYQSGGLTKAKEAVKGTLFE